MELFATLYIRSQILISMITLGNIGDSVFCFPSSHIGDLTRVISKAHTLDRHTTGSDPSPIFLYITFHLGAPITRIEINSVCLSLQENLSFPSKRICTYMLRIYCHCAWKMGNSCSFYCVKPCCSPPLFPIYQNLESFSSLPYPLCLFHHVTNVA